MAKSGSKTYRALTPLVLTTTNQYIPEGAIVELQDKAFIAWALKNHAIETADGEPINRPGAETTSPPVEFPKKGR